jgi:hypothetical protein
MLEELEVMVMHITRLTYHQLVEESEARKAPQNQAPDAAPTPPARRPTESTRTVFYRLVRFFRDTVKLRASLAAGEIPRFARPRIPNDSFPNDRRLRDSMTGTESSENADSPQPPAEIDPRVDPVAAYVFSAAKAAPRNRRKPEILRRIPTRLAETILADPNLTLTGAEIALKLCKEFHLPYNIAKMNQDPILSRNLAKPPSTTPQGTGPP